MTTNETNESTMSLMDAMLTIENFWAVDEDEQEKALEVAYRCMLRVYETEVEDEGF